MNSSIFRALLQRYAFGVGLILLAVFCPCFADMDGPTLGLPALPSQSVLPASRFQTVLGRKLFFDLRLSADGTVRCASCHDPKQAFSDGRKLAQGISGHVGTRNTPSLLNVAYSTSLFWDGRRASLEAQALDPLVNPREHAMGSVDVVVARVRGDAEYQHLFRAAFGVGTRDINADLMAKAIARFERTLLAADSPFDRFFYGHEHTALSEGAKRGLALFDGRARCAGCHTLGKSSALFTDNAFHGLNVGLQHVAPRIADLTTKLVAAKKTGASIDQAVLGEEDLAELGRFVVTLDPATVGQFRTPSLRNVALTAPYMHDGSVPTLAAAVDLELYSRGQSNGHPLILTPAERADLVEFLESLTSPFASSTEGEKE